jgi:hypothetical protein
MSTSPLRPIPVPDEAIEAVRSLLSPSGDYAKVRSDLTAVRNANESRSELQRE